MSNNETHPKTPLPAKCCTSAEALEGVFAFLNRKGQEAPALAESFGLTPDRNESQDLGYYCYWRVRLIHGGGRPLWPTNVGFSRFAIEPLALRAESTRVVIQGMSQMLRVPECDCRVETEQGNVYLCRHPKVHARGNVVEGGVCAICDAHASPCPNPRPVNPGEVTDARKPPPFHIKAWNLAAALTAFVADGLRTVTKEEYRERWRICDGCDERRGTKCLQCGCRLAWKATGRAFECPLDKWPELRAEQEHRTEENTETRAP